ncbi:MAG: LysM peptidoglycan-binding domain-containing protein [Alistipes sp.]|nr:LysM peptidoglycan-binding domain-containing protein [Alistipes sp.]
MGGVKRFILLGIVALLGVGCGGGTSASDESSKVSRQVVEEVTGDASKVDHIVISKESRSLKVYDVDNRLVCRFDVAIGRGEGDKQEVGDMCTPEGEFTILSIEDASQWLYDSGEGVVEGYYGEWFIRLSTEFKGIGIYGTSDSSIIGERATEGSIRLLDSDLDSLKNLVSEGMKVRIDAKEVHIAEARAVITDKVEEVAEVMEATEEQNTVAESTQESESSQSTAVENVANEGKQIWHTVVDGELLGRIVRNYGTTVSEIKRLNPDINVDRLSIGQRILISDGTVAPKSEEKRPAVVEREGEEWYTLQPGDVVGRVAQRYGTTSKRIAELNPDINIDRVRDGQRIRVK